MINDDDRLIKMMIIDS